MEFESNDVERLAIVGDKEWEKTMAVISVFTRAQVRYFDMTQEENAQWWISEISEQIRP